MIASDDDVDDAFSDEDSGIEIRMYIAKNARQIENQAKKKDGGPELSRYIALCHDIGMRIAKFALKQVSQQGMDAQKVIAGWFDAVDAEPKAPVWASAPKDAPGKCALACGKTATRSDRDQLSLCEPHYCLFQSFVFFRVARSQLVLACNADQVDQHWEFVIGIMSGIESTTGIPVSEILEHVPKKC